jgi:hypothetical protein
MLKAVLLIIAAFGYNFETGFGAINLCFVFRVLFRNQSKYGFKPTE